MHHPTDRMIHTTAFVTPVVGHWLEREIAQWVHPMKDRSDDPSHDERTLLPRSYISLPSRYDVRAEGALPPSITVIAGIKNKLTLAYVSVRRINSK